MRIKGVLFDFDGTLTRPGALDFPAIKKEIGCPSDEPILEYLGTLPEEERKGLGGILEKREKQAALAAVPNRNAEACLLELRRRGLPLGILTRNSLESVQLALQAFHDMNAADFMAVVTREASRPKPNPDGVFRACHLMSLRPDQLVVVGDFRFDIIAGRAAGTQTVLLTNGIPDIMLPEDPPPGHRIEHLGELPHLLTRL
jgi:HAD superfamily hydrolase (TIGR01509 family)